LLLILLFLVVLVFTGQPAPDNGHTETMPQGNAGQRPSFLARLFVVMEVPI